MVGQKIFCPYGISQLNSQDLIETKRRDAIYRA